MLTHPTLPPSPTSPILWERIEALLHQVQKPGRYVGGEFNAVDTPWDAADFRSVLAFLDSPDIGMSNFALMILYDLLNRHPGMLAHHLPAAPDMVAQMRRDELPCTLWRTAILSSVSTSWRSAAPTNSSLRTP